ncbi:glycosyltransferase family 2 protein [Marinoscillum sp.]|uniref:glycosyltransferase family 2 protein n=1 Tax=Marinoscillum sp. TaxID=2024838 RepID=UPI003BA8A025
MSQLVSVIIPTYNRPDQLHQAVSSALSQTHTEVEVIVVNDGGAIEPLGELFHEYPEIAIHHLESKAGVSKARNVGIDLARGDYLVFLDDDDLLAPDYLASAVQEIGQADILIAAGSVVGDLSSIHFQRVAAYNDWLDQTYAHRLTSHWGFFLQYMPPIFSMLFKRSVFDSSRFNEQMHYGEDRELLLRLRSTKTFERSPLHSGTYNVRSSEEVAPLLDFTEAIRSLVDSRRGRSYISLLEAYYWFSRRKRWRAVRSIVTSLQSPYVVVKQFLLFLRLNLLR